MAPISHNSNSISGTEHVALDSEQYDTTTASKQSSSSSSSTTAPTPFQIGIGLLIVGASAGMTLYTRKTQAMLNQMKRMEENRAMRLPKKKFGPPTKEEWEKLRNRWTNDDL
mmetsp:Transcript_4773/g.9114  ORF Transcript_4773/g.9114 Transcript_4773/m.9114 type:complete len:112 (-) Transcript_4773:426-761(-)|eukprot:CAMPEP_0176499124 /NCGR_PEP_ID=MMETSP0200_2-20121128/12737_1 /TAXON_ID=947934 /ORGANISM="Chaetoceros sp., Strain GSL56" /LENGTH=111 /DNA_ID=CAMNT_0017897477 /DNA_START=326 /DNA_END=661 /DNA_ORIENTATION=-